MPTGDKFACLVEVAPTSSWGFGNKKKAEASCSGVLMNSSYVITHASLLAPSLSANAKLLNRLSKHGCLSSRHMKEPKALVTLAAQSPHSDKCNTARGKNISQYFTAMFNVNTRKADCDTRNIRGQVQLVWKAKNLASTLEKIFPKSEGWSFHDNPTNDSEQERNDDKENFDPAIASMLMPYFVLIKLDHWTTPEKYTGHLDSRSIRRGSECFVVGTPFGNLSPSIFLNSYSRGIICNKAGKQGELLMTDARCIPGTEGAPLLTRNRDGFVLTGLVIAPLCWKSNEWMGLSLAGSMQEVLASLADVLKIDGAKLKLDYSAVDLVEHYKSNSLEEKLGSATFPAVLVWNRGTWGSGIILDQNEAIVATCSHVVLSQTSVTVGVDDEDGRVWHKAEVLFATPPEDVWDVAILKMADYSPRARWPHATPMMKRVHEGQEVAVIGHSMFGRQHQQSPSITSGIISKISTVGGAPVCIQSTCTVTSGASGGPLVAPSGHVVGLVACNAKDTVSGASFPNVNLSVPIGLIWSAVRNFLDSGEVEDLQKLHVKSEIVKSIWKLEETSMSEDIPWRSKL